MANNQKVDTTYIPEVMHICTSLQPPECQGWRQKWLLHQQRQRWHLQPYIFQREPPPVYPPQLFAIYQCPMSPIQKAAYTMCR